MTAVFLGGSRRITRLTKPVVDRIDRMIDQGFQILVGDANGGDRAFQTYLAEREYPKVTVFSTDGGCRNNVGGWQVRAVPFEGEGRKRSFAFFAAKDDAMVKDADYGLLLWDGKSKGTLRNVLNMARLNKPSVVYVASRREFRTVKDVSSAEELAALGSREAREYVGAAMSQLAVGDDSLLPAS